MNDADIARLEAQSISPDINSLILTALMTIQLDLRELVERVESIEQMMIAPPNKWDDDIEVTNPPF